MPHATNDVFCLMQVRIAVMPHAINNVLCLMQVRNDLRSQGLEVPDAVARPAASPELALAALREVENQPHAGRQHKTEEPEISDDDEDVEQEGDIGGRYEEEIMEVCILNLTLSLLTFFVKQLLMGSFALGTD